MNAFTRALFAAILPWASCLPNSAYAVWETVVDGSSFNDTAALTTAWNYAYPAPWGTDHNGSARMFTTNVVVDKGVVTVSSWPLPPAVTEGASSQPPYCAIHYHSGAFYLKQPITICSRYPVWDISVQTKTPSVTGTWPCVWINGVNSWPPESDIMEFRGSSTVWQNTYNGVWQRAGTAISDPGGSWHTYRLVASLEDSTHVDFHYYVDGNMMSGQTSTTFVGVPCWLIVDFQMEGGSGWDAGSGSPGPATPQFFFLANLVAKRENLSLVGSGPVANGTYKFHPANTRDVLEVRDHATANNSPLVQRPGDDGLNQQWILTHLGNNQYSILGRQSGRALEVLDTSSNNGARAVIGDYTAASNQIWKIVPASGRYFNLINLKSGKPLRAPDNSTPNLVLVKQGMAERKHAETLKRDGK